MAIAQKEELIQSSFSVLDGKQREANRKTLQPVLTDLIALGRVLKQLHWNITGPGFRPIHQHLDEIYDLVDESVDEVAERLVATGHAANGRIVDVAKDAEIEDAPLGFLTDREVLRLAEHSVKRTVELVRSRTEGIEELDTATADLLHQIALGLEKHHWMLQAQRV